MAYLPTSDNGLLDWALNFATLIVASPTTYGLEAEQAGGYQAQAQFFESALQAAIEPSTRTPVTVQAKNDAKTQLVELSRGLAMIVTNHPGVTNEQRVALGLTVRDREPSPVPPPSGSPDIDVLLVTGRTVTVRLHDASTPGRRKPANVAGAAVFSFVGETAPADPAVWTFQGNTTRTRFDVSFPADVPAGAKVWITAFWFNRRMQSGPGTPPVSTNLQYGGMAQAA